MTENVGGKVWRISDDLTSPTGEANHNEMAPLGFVYQTPSQEGSKTVTVNGLNWVKTDGTRVELGAQTVVLPFDSQDNFVYVDSGGTLQVASGSFPDPSVIGEYFACSRVAVDAVPKVTERHFFGIAVINPGTGASVSGEVIALKFTIVTPPPSPSFPLTFTPINTTDEAFLVFLKGVRLQPGVHYNYNIGGNSIDWIPPLFPLLAGDVILINYQRI